MKSMLLDSCEEFAISLIKKKIRWDKKYAASGSLPLSLVAFIALVFIQPARGNSLSVTRINPAVWSVRSRSCNTNQPL